MKASPSDLKIFHSEYSDIYKHVICQDIYQIDLFNKIIRLINAYDYYQFSSQQIEKLLPINWNGKKYLNKNKDLIIITFPFNNKLPIQKYSILQQLSKEEIKNIQNKIENDDGMFLAQFQKIPKSKSLIFLDSNIEKQINKQITLCHQLIHYFQWNTGRSIYDIKKIINNDQENLKEINQIFNSNLTIEDINCTLNKDELATYSFQLFNSLKHYFHNKEILKILIENLYSVIISNNGNLKFKQYYQNCLDRLKMIDSFKYIEQLKTIIFQLNILQLFLSGFYCIGFYTIKNHIYGYLNKLV